MLSTIKSEVKDEKHKEFGCHILVVMTHGGEDNCIYGTDLEKVNLTDLYDLLTPLYFDRMRRKPKVVILEASSGGNHCFVI